MPLSLSLSLSHCFIKFATNETWIESHDIYFVHLNKFSISNWKNSQQTFDEDKQCQLCVSFAYFFFFLLAKWNGSLLFIQINIAKDVRFLTQIRENTWTTNLQLQFNIVMDLISVGTDSLSFISFCIHITRKLHNAKHRRKKMNDLSRKWQWANSKTIIVI